MNSGKILLTLLFGIFFIIQTSVMIKHKKLLSCLFLTAAQGICALLAVNLIGGFISVKIPINFWSITVSGAFGISGIILLLIGDILFLTP